MGEARFVHPKEFGMDFPINTQEELCAISRSINGGRNRVGAIGKDGKYVVIPQAGKTTGEVKK